MRTWRRFVFGFQWVVPVVLAIWWFFTPGAGTGGWAMVLMLVVAPVVALLLVVPAVIVVCGRARRRARTTSVAYGWAAPVLWLVALVPPAFMEGASDMRSYPSIGQHLFGLSSAAASAVVPVSALLFLVCWIGAVVTSALPAAASDVAAADRERTTGERVTVEG